MAEAGFFYGTYCRLDTIHEIVFCRVTCLLGAARSAREHLAPRSSICCRFAWRAFEDLIDFDVSRVGISFMMLLNTRHALRSSRRVAGTFMVAFCLHTSVAQLWHIASACCPIAPRCSATFFQSSSAVGRNVSSAWL